MKKIIGTIGDIIDNYQHLYHFDYGHHFKDSENYMPLSKALSIIGYELAPSEREYEGDYNEIRCYLGCEICEMDNEMDDEDLSKYFGKIFRNICYSDIDKTWNLLCEESLSLVGKKNNKSVEELGYNAETKTAYYKYEYSDKEIHVPLERLYKNLKVIN